MSLIGVVDMTNTNIFCLNNFFVWTLIAGQIFFSSQFCKHQYALFTAVHCNSFLSSPPQSGSCYSKRHEFGLKVGSCALAPTLSLIKKKLIAHLLFQLLIPKKSYWHFALSRNIKPPQNVIALWTNTSEFVIGCLKS